MTSATSAPSNLGRAPTDLPGDPPDRDLGSPQRVGAFMVLVAIGIAARIVFMVISFGSNDMAIWTGFAESIRSDGLWPLYETDSLFNHPPLMGMMAAGLHQLAEVTGIAYPSLFKIPILLGDLAVLVVLKELWGNVSRRAAWIAMAVFACNPVSILVTGHHGNTDSLCGALLLIAVRQQHKGAMFTAGLALAAAGNVKIVAAMCLPALLLLIRDRQAVQRYLLGGIVGSLPFAVALIFGGTAFFENVFLYGSMPGQWGPSAAVTMIDGIFGLGAEPRDVILAYMSPGRFVLLAGFAVLAVLGRRRAWSPYRAAAMTYAAFLVLTPGWGIQYHVWIVATLAGLSTRLSRRYAIVVGAFVAAVYLSHLTDEFPLRTEHGSSVLYAIVALGLIGWVGIIVAIWTQAQVVGGRKSDEARELQRDRSSDSRGEGSKPREVQGEGQRRHSRRWGLTTGH